MVNADMSTLSLPVMYQVLIFCPAEDREQYRSELLLSCFERKSNCLSSDNPISNVKSQQSGIVDY